MSKYSVDDVFGVSRDLPLNYVARTGVDEEFVIHLAQRKNIVVFGSSKQGKTSLRKQCLRDDDYVVISASNKWSLAELNAAILKSAGYTTELSTSRTLSGSAKLILQLEAKGGIPFLATAKGNAAIEGEAGASTETTRAPLEIDPKDANDLIRALNEANFTKYIVIEDFHYLPEETQRDFSFELKNVHENSSHCFIIIGVWREKNRLIGFNGDLTERLVSIDADSWSNDELKEVMAKGEALLNISLDTRFKERVVDLTYQSVHLVQEACRRVCRDEGILTTQEVRRIVAANADTYELISRIVADQSGRYNGFLHNIAEGFQRTTKEMPLWVVYAILKSSNEELSKGLRLATLAKIIKRKHPDGENLNLGNLTQILKTFASLQSKKGIRPIIADYDTQNRILFVVDRGFEIWLSSQDRTELLQELGLPTD